MIDRIWKMEKNCLRRAGVGRAGEKAGIPEENAGKTTESRRFDLQSKSSPKGELLADMAHFIVPRVPQLGYSA